jgi:hypothetical protein
MLGIEALGVGIEGLNELGIADLMRGPIQTASCDEGLIHEAGF